MARVRPSTSARDVSRQSEYRRVFRGAVERAEIAVMRNNEDPGAREYLRRVRHLDEKVRAGKLTYSVAWSLARGMPTIAHLRAQILQPRTDRLIRRIGSAPGGEGEAS